MCQLLKSQPFPNFPSTSHVKLSSAITPCSTQTAFVSRGGASAWQELKLPVADVEIVSVPSAMAHRPGISTPWCRELWEI